jgi:tRNA uridine 5-carboxymethylaminomethyl modification enzyme
LAAAKALLEALSATPAEIARAGGLKVSADGTRRSAWRLLSHDQVSLARLSKIWPKINGIDSHLRLQVEADAKYAVYVARQQGDIDALRRDETLLIPPNIDYSAVGSLSNELRDKLQRVRPETLGHAARIPGMTPAALTALLGHVRKRHGPTAATRRAG